MIGTGDMASQRRAAIIDDDTAILLIPRCASTSIKAALRGRGIINLDAETTTRQLHVFVRDPVERLRSTYSVLFSDHMLTPKRTLDDEWRSFVDRVLTGPVNGHWRPQAHFIGGEDVLVHLFEDLDEVWPTVCDDAVLPWENATTELALSDYRIEDLMLHYDLDYQLRSTA